MSARGKTIGLAAALLLAAPAYAQPPAAPVQATQAQVQALMDPQVEEHLRAVTAALPGFSTLQTLRGRLAPAAKQSVTITAEEGLFNVAAVCDDACGDIDLRMIGPDGSVVFADERDSKFPLTQADVKGKVAFNIELVMKACAKENCAWAVRFYRKAQGQPAAK